MDCRFCTKTFSKTYQCYVHKKLQTFTCKYCQKQFYSDPQLKQHEIDHVEFKRFCKICNATIVGKELYVHHRRIHMRLTFNRTKKFECDICNRSFTYEKAFKAHFFKCVNKPSQLQCDFCSAKPFKRKFDLEQHLRKHTSEYTYNCIYCNKGFLRKSDLVAHIGSHNVNVEDHPFKCEYCGQVFAKQYNLDRHELRFHYENSTEENYAQLIGLKIEFLD